MASYGGATIFGTVVKSTSNMNPIRTTRRAFFGLEGLVQVYGGGSGGTIVFSGILYDTTTAGIEAQCDNWKSLADGVGRTLVDTVGKTYNNVVLDQFAVPPGTRRQNVAAGTYEVEYQAVFTVLV